MQIRKHLYRVFFFLMASYGLLYFSYKWEDPTRVNTDFIEYYGMVQHPFDFHAAPAPWVYRQWTTLTAHALWRMHVYYPDQIQFHSAFYDTRIFFAMLFTNYLGVVAAAWLSSVLVDRYLQERGQSSTVFPLLAGLLCFLSFYIQVTTISGQADGLSWAFIALGYVFYRRRALLPLAGVLLLSILQREILPLIFLTLSLTEIFASGVQNRVERRFRRWTALWSAVCFGFYLLLKHLVHAPGNEYQSDPHAVLHQLASFRPGRAYVMQVLMGQNLLILLFGLWVIWYVRCRQWSRNLLTIPICCLMLLCVAAMADISNNASRMVAMLTPIFTAEIAWAIFCMEQKGKAASA